MAATEVDIIKQAPGIRRDGQTPLASAELYVIIDLPKKSTPDAPANVPMRGIEPAGMRVREEVSIIEGRMFAVRHQRSHRRPRRQRAVCRISKSGTTIVSGQNRWQVVGVFEADGGVAESEIWCDCAVAAGRLPAREFLPVGARQPRLAGFADGVQRLADDQPGGERAWSGARTNTTPASRRR